MSRALRALGTVDGASGAFALVAASWLSGQLDFSIATVRFVGAFLVVLGLDKIVFASRPAMGRIATVTEVLFAIACIIVAVVADPTAAGATLLVGTAGMCAIVAARLIALQRISDPVVSAQHLAAGHH